ALLPLPAAGQGAPAGGADAPRGVPVEARKVSVERVVDRVTTVGSTRADQSIIVRPELAGVVTKINFTASARVEKGALLVSLDDTIARSEVALSEASLTLAQKNYERTVDLLGRGNVPARQRDEDLAKLDAARASVALTRAKLAKTRIEAPFAGTVGIARIDLGAYVEAGQDLVTLDDSDPIKIDADLPERYLRFMREGQAVEIQFDALPGQTFTGEMEAISPRVDQAGRSIAVRARVPNGNGKLKPGLFARLALIVAERDEAIVVPEQAIFARGANLFVYRVIDGKAVSTKVDVGLRVFGRAEIVGGLARDEVIVTAGHDKIRNGALVTVLAPRDN
ncbi:MAG: efflux RND transporter periplasmic adaptor subunit, partial [Alphaproteobacteria bacterium]|nr:efflux RND transporter periplasmic adaptor subunit [Alphaproteobacteria bacterium]